MLFHPEADRLERALVTCMNQASPWSGDWFRFAIPRFANKDHLLSGEGGLFAGGRWHPMGLFRAVYASLEPETSLAEALAHYRRFHFADGEALPRTLCAVSVRLHHVLDLTQGILRQRLRLSWKRIFQEKWWEGSEGGQEAITQSVGRLARDQGLEALLVPSAARPSGKNMVFFPDNRHPDSRLEIIHPEKLLPWQV